MNEFNQRIVQPGEDFRVADRMEILDVMWRYMVALDIGDQAMYEQCFTDPLQWDLSDNPVCWTGNRADFAAEVFSRREFVDAAWSRDDVVDHPEREHPVRQFYQHGVLNPLITFTGPKEATVLAYQHEHIHEWFDDTPGRERVKWSDLGGFYHNDFAAVDGRWRISFLRLKNRFFDPEQLYKMYYPRRVNEARLREALEARRK